MIAGFFFFFFFFNILFFIKFRETNFCWCTPR